MRAGTAAACAGSAGLSDRPRRDRTRHSPPRARPADTRTNSSSVGGSRGDVGAKLRELALEVARHDREPAPRARIDVAIVEVERRCQPLALPLVTAPQPEEPVDPL